MAVFGLLKRGGKVYTAIIPNSKTESILPIIHEKVSPDSIVYTDTFRAYNALDVSNFHHVRINHSKLFADKKNHINGIENFWNQAKRHMRRFNGIKKKTFTGSQKSASGVSMVEIITPFSNSFFTGINALNTNP